jgi:hypothetical protein
LKPFLIKKKVKLVIFIYQPFKFWSKVLVWKVLIQRFGPVGMQSEPPCSVSNI